MTDTSVWTQQDRPPGSGGRRRKDRRGGLAVVLALVLILVLVGGFAAVLLGAGSKLDGIFGKTADDYAGPGTGSVQISVESGQSVAAIARTMKSKGVIKTVDAFVQIASGDPKSGSIQPGTYQLRRHMSSADAFAALFDPKAKVQAKLLLREGLRLDDASAKILAGTGISKDDLQKAIDNASALGLPDYAKGNVEGFMFPATYDVPPGRTADDLLRQMFEAYTAAATKAGVDRTNRSPLEIVTIASLLEAEVNSPDDYAKVARVVYNRLDAGMRMQFDTTVHYALYKEGKDIDKLTHAELKVDSPYNTYTHDGLPPAPIDSPGLAAMTAAVNPAKGNWLYFVTTDPKTGETKFTNSYNEFLQFKAEYKANS